MSGIRKSLVLKRYGSFIVLFIIVFTIPGFEKKELKNQVNYLQGEVDGLQGEVTGLEKENKNLQSRLKDIGRLEKELAAMNAKMDSVSELPGTLYS